MADLTVLCVVALLVSVCAEQESAPQLERVLTVDNSSFLGAFNFFTADDPTHGSVEFVSASEALASHMVSTTDGQILMSVDRKSQSVPRKSVRVFSQQTFSTGIFVVDLSHMPTGCGTWPAFWLCGPAWPNGGEIDILEGVHRQDRDQTTLHTSADCSMADVDRDSFSGDWGKGIGGVDATDCYVKAASQFTNEGCAIVSDKSASFGAPFNAQGGGVVATVWDEDGIRAYSWPRQSLPSDIAARSGLNESSWGVPYAPASGSARALSRVHPDVCP